VISELIFLERILSLYCQPDSDGKTGKGGSQWSFLTGQSRVELYFGVARLGDRAKVDPLFIHVLGVWSCSNRSAILELSIRLDTGKILLLRYI
jgi:hypothetical protein